METFLLILLALFIAFVVWILPLLIGMAILRLENWMEGKQPWEEAYRIDPVMQWLIGTFGIPVFFLWVLPSWIVKKTLSPIAGTDLIQRWWRSILLMYK